MTIGEPGSSADAAMAESEADEIRAIRHEYQDLGVEGFYRREGSSYRNPHEPQIQKSLDVVVRERGLDLSRVLDLAAGSGEVTLALRKLGASNIDAIDPYAHDAYVSRTGAPASRETFEEIAAGALAGRNYSLIVCSFAMHLFEDSRLARLTYQLSCIGDRLLILTPHKRPRLREEWGWTLDHERVVQRVRSRLYRSRWRIAGQ
jgi:2-polyprenyl-3-methyl-5-hydroxy-6-metoxy-1,4-benzoquinol methylase